MLYGVKQFNLHPERGLKYLEENGFLENSPESVARFLFRQERLSKKQIGELLRGFLLNCNCVFREISWQSPGVQQRSVGAICEMP